MAQPSHEAWGQDGDGGRLRCRGVGPEPSPGGTVVDGAAGADLGPGPASATHRAWDKARQWCLRRAPQDLRHPDVPTVVHLVSLAGAFAFWVWLDRGLWFFGDEWDFLVGRGVFHWPGNHASIWFPHNEHWSTLPVLLWRGLFSVFHLSSYWPYLIPVLLAQVAIMHLVWRMCRRNGSHPWVATAAVVLLGFLGAGAEDLAWAFQIGFVGAVLFGLVALDLIDRDRLAVGAAAGTAGGPAGGTAAVARRRDLLIAACLLASLMCSTLGDAMVAGAAVLASARLPKRRLLWAIGPPVVAYVIWFAGVGHQGLTAHSDRVTLSTFTTLPGYVWTGLSSALGQVFNLQTAGAALLVGLGAWVAWHGRQLWTGQPALVALVVASLGFYALAGVGRDASEADPALSRYVYVATALLLPVIAAVLSSLGAWPAARLAAIGLLAFSALGNVGQAQTWVAARLADATANKTDLFAIGELLASGAQDISGPLGAPVPQAPNLTVAGIARLERSHVLPRPPMSPLDLVNARTVLAAGTWNGFNMTLTPKPVSAGRFRLVKVGSGVARAVGDGCTMFSPQAISPAMQIWLKIPAAAGSASVKVEASPAPPGTINYLAALIVPGRPPSTSVPLELAVPAKGTGYLSDNYPAADLVIAWVEGTSLTLCGLSPGP